MSAKKSYAPEGRTSSYSASALGVLNIPEGLIQKQDPNDALLCRAW